MHHRIDVARGTLDAQLLRRVRAPPSSWPSAEVLDPPSRLVLLDAAHRARNAGPEEFEAAESALSAGAAGGVRRRRRACAALRADADRRAAGRRARPRTAPGSSWPGGSTTTCVVSARALRSRRRVRWLRLAGRAAELRTVDLDDVPPAGLDGR